MSKSSPPTMQQAPLEPTSGNKKHGKELTPYMRGLIVGYASGGGTVTEVARALGIPRTTVRTTLARNPERENGKSKPRSGRPRVLSERDIRHILQVIRKEPFISIREIKRQLQLACSLKTISSGLARTGHGYWISRNRPQIQAEHAKKRYEFACKYQDWDWPEWSKVVFVDKCAIELALGKSQKWILRLNRASEKWGKARSDSLKKDNQVRIMVWVAVWGERKSDLLPFSRDFDSHKQNYTSEVEILQEMVPSIWEPGLLFMDDPSRETHASSKWLEDQGVSLIEWPPCSPDLNPIEDLWFPLKEAMHSVNPDIEHSTGGKDHVGKALEEIAIEAWNRLKTERVMAVVKSMKDRLQAVRDTRGWCTGF